MKKDAVILCIDQRQGERRYIMKEQYWFPSIEVESNNGTREVSLFTHNLMKGNIFLQGEINAAMANCFLSQIMFLVSSGADPINVFINSGGGEVQAGLMIYDIIMAYRKRIRLYCTGMAASMAAILLSSGLKGKRYILPHSKTMIHEPLITDGIGGSASTIRDVSDSIMKTRKICNEILAKNTGKSLREIDQITMHDHYMSAEESVKFGICDSIVTTLPGI